MRDLKGKYFLITGVANKKSVAFHVAKTLVDYEANVIFSVQSENHVKQIQKHFPTSPYFICDVEKTEDIKSIKSHIKEHTDKLDGILHSMAYAKFDPDRRLYHETKLEDFLQAAHISCFSLNQITHECMSVLDKKASIVTIGISNTKATSYGYLGPIKAMLETSVSYLAKSLSEVGQIRVNCVASGPLKTSASAGIPNYIENFIYSEALTLRKQSLETKEVANTAVYLLSQMSSGINAESITVDAGMNANYFDQQVVKNFAKEF